MNRQNKLLTDVNPFVPQPARIVRTYYLTEDVKFFQVRIVDMGKALSFEYLPGQFAMISVLGAGEAPFCLSSTPSRPGLLEFCIRKAGAVTDALFRMKENDLIGLRGPYGNGFLFAQFCFIASIIATNSGEFPCFMGPKDLLK
jgi:sulfhydrogenase subunit gamma (sulfur reductase)